jgi:hypothetical protein
MRSLLFSLLITTAAPDLAEAGQAENEEKRAC